MHPLAARLTHSRAFPNAVSARQMGFQCTKQVTRNPIRALRVAAPAYGVYRLARQIFLSTASAAAASAKNSSANSAALTVP